MNLKLKIKNALSDKSNILSSEERLKFFIRQNYLLDKILNCEKSGISSEKYADHEIIVSLTTYSKRLYEVAFTIESIMQGTLKPNRIVLWLDEGLKDTPLPLTLQHQQKRGLEISFFCKDIRSYKKLIPTLCKYPEAAVITVDDDALYNFDLVENLVNAHIRSPHHIIANRIHRIVLGENKRPINYLKWDWYASPTDNSPLNFFTGVGGVLYPPHSLHPEVMNEAVFCEICQYADDVWFKAMALKAGTKVIKGYTHNKRGEDYLMNSEVQDIGLWNTYNNSTICSNDIQLKAVFDKYDLWGELLK